MTGEELERAIDFLLKSQARAEARIEQQGADFQKRLDSIANAHASLEEAHTNLVRVLTQYIETQDGINKSLRETDVRQARFSASLGESLRASDGSLRAAMTELATRQGRTETTVDRLSQKVEALVKIVEEGRNGGQ